MKISVIIPVFNGIKHLPDALESIYQQTHQVDEIICVDDASTDDTYSFLCESFPEIKLLKNDINMGPSHSRNRGIREATGSLITFIDADDKWAPDKLKWQYLRLKTNSSLDVVGGLTQDLSLNEESESKVHFNTYLGSLLIKKTVFDKIGLFNESMRLSEDQDWFLRLRESGMDYEIMEQVVLFKRVHESNITKGLTFEQSGLIQALKQSLDRRRSSRDYQNLKEIKIINNDSKEPKK